MTSLIVPKNRPYKKKSQLTSLERARDEISFKLSPFIVKINHDFYTWWKIFFNILDKYGIIPVEDAPKYAENFAYHEMYIHYFVYLDGESYDILEVDQQHRAIFHFLSKYLKNIHFRPEITVGQLHMIKVNSI